MFDFKFDWQDDLNTNINNIDEHHKELFHIARDIEQLLLTGCSTVETKRILEIICHLREYVSYHFYEEEKMMRKANYSNYEEHMKYHDKFKKIIVNIQLISVELNPQEELKRIKDSIQDLIFQHIMFDDKQMVEEILKNSSYI